MASLQRNTIFYGLQTFAERILSFFVLPLLTKTLPTEFYGIWTQIIITAGLFAGLFGFHTGVVRFLAGHKDPREMNGFFHKILGVVLSIAALFCLATVIFAAPFSRAMLGNEASAHLLPVFGVFVAMEILFELVTAHLRANEHIGPLSVYQFIKSAGRVGLLALGILVIKVDLGTVLLWLIFLQLALLAWMYGKHILRDGGFHFHSPSIPWREFLSFSLPLIPYGLLMWGNNFSDRYVILHVLNMKEVSIYAVSYSIAGTVSVLYAVLGFTIYPNLARLWNQGRSDEVARKLSKATEYYLFFSLPLVALLTLLHQPLVRLLAKSEFVSQIWVMFWLSSGIVAFGVYQLNYYITLLAKKNLLNILILVVSSLINVGVNLAVVPRVGIVGAAFTTFLSNGVLAGATIWLARRTVAYRFEWKPVPRMLAGTLALSAFLLILSRWVSVEGVIRIALASGVSLCLYAVVDFASKDSYLLHLRKAL